MAKDIETKKEEQQEPTREQLTNAVNILGRQKLDLETEVGRLTMLNRAYEEQFADMRKVIKQLEMAAAQKG